MANERIFRRFSAARTYNEKNRSVQATLATEIRLKVWDYDNERPIDEILLMSGVILPDSGQIPLLDSHNQGSIRNILGSCRNLHIENDDRLVGNIFFSNDNGGKILEQHVRDGHLTDLSICAELLEIIEIKEGETESVNGKKYDGLVRLVTRWAPLEASAVSIGADKNSTIRSKHKMENEQITTGQNQAPNPDEIISERERVAGIYDICRISNFNQFAESFVREGISVDVARAKIFEHMKRTNPPIGPGAIQVGLTGEEKRDDAIVDGLVMRAGFKLDKPAPGSENFRHASLVDIARLNLSTRSKFRDTVRGMSPAQVIRTAMTTRMHTTSDYPAILANVMGKMLRTEYLNYPASFEAWTVKGEGRDFKEMSRVQLSEAPELLKIPEGAEYKHGTFGESKEVFSICKYGRMFGISWEAMINDDLSAFSRIPRAFVSSAKRGLNTMVYAELINNGVMGDGLALFHETHNNIAVGANIGTIDLSRLTEARRAMRTQAGIQTSDPLNIEPAFLIVPAALETYADQIINTIQGYESSQGPGASNPFYKKLQVIVEPYLDTNSAYAWYLAADPRRFDTVEVAYLDGQDVPYTEEKEGWDVDSWEIKIRFCYGIKALDFRGLYCNPGEEQS